MAQFDALLLRAMAETAGNETPGRFACRFLAERLRLGTLTPSDTEFLASALEKIAHGTNAEVALRIKRKRQRPGKFKFHREIYESVEALKSSGITFAEAYRQVAIKERAQFPGSEDLPIRQIERIHQKMRSAFEAYRSIE